MHLEPTFTVASIDGSSIAAYDFGGSGETMLIAHATGFCGAMYLQFAQHLTTDFRVISFDFRGHGASAGQAGIDLNWDRMGEDLLAVAHSVGGGPMHGFGHSMGAAALLLAESAAPGRFRSLFLYEPISFPEGVTTDGQNFMAQVARRRRPRFDSRAEVLYRYADRPPFNEMRAGFAASYVDNAFVDDAENGGIRLCCLPEHEAVIFESGRHLRFDRVKHIATPTVVAIGREVPGSNPAQLGAPIAEGLSNGRLIRYPHLDHLGPFQDPWTVARDLSEHARGRAASV